MVTWASSDTAVAYMNANLAADSGLPTSLAPGNTTISATISTTTSPISNSATLTVNAAVITSVTVTPATPQMINGFSQQFTANAIYSDQSTVDVTSTATWSSADTAVVTMNPSGTADSGLATPVMVGSTIITATLDATTSGNTTVTVVDAALVSIAITPITPSVAAGTTQQMLATGTFNNGSTMNLNRFVEWQTADAAIATFNPNFMNNSGLLSALVMGNTDVSASLNGVVATTPTTVTAAILVSLAVTPLNPVMSDGQTLQMQVIGTYSDNSTANHTADATWSSSNTSVAIYNPNQQPNSGLLSAIAAGSSTLSATFATANLGSFTSNTLLTVTGVLAANPSAPVPRTETAFVIAASQGISTTAGSQINNGDIAIFDTDRAAFTGFNVGASAGQFTELTGGISFAPDDTNPPYSVPMPYASSAAYLAQLKSDMISMAAYLAAETNPTAGLTTLNNKELGGVILNRGVYHLPGDGMISQGNLSLDAQGDVDSVFIIHISGNFSMEALAGNILLINGANANNVYLRVGGDSILGNNRQFVGTLVSTGNILVQTGASVQGHLFSLYGNIALNANSVTKPL
jgi:hypothetical protein